MTRTTQDNQDIPLLGVRVNPNEQDQLTPTDNDTE